MNSYLTIAKELQEVDPRAVDFSFHQSLMVLVDVAQNLIKQSKEEKLTRLCSGEEIAGFSVKEVKKRAFKDVKEAEKIIFEKVGKIAFDTKLKGLTKLDAILGEEMMSELTETTMNTTLTMDN